MKVPPLVFRVSDFVAVVNQSLEFAFPYVMVEGEVLECKVSKGRWVFLTLKDEWASLRCFATVHALPGPIEPGMMLRVQGSPRLHEKYGFSLQVQQVSLHGQGALQKGLQLLRTKLQAEGLFDPARKRALPSIPTHIAVVTAVDSAACADFLKIARARWAGVRIDLYDTYVQGDEAPASLLQAISTVQNEPELPDVLVIVRGGGSTEDLAAFNHEEVVRAVAASRVPTVVAIGHEVDVCLSELVADVRASTPSNAAELLLPDKQSERQRLKFVREQFQRALVSYVGDMRRRQLQNEHSLRNGLNLVLERHVRAVEAYATLLHAYNPRLPLERGYAVVRDDTGKQIGSVDGLSTSDTLQICFKDGDIITEVKKVHETKRSA